MSFLPLYCVSFVEDIKSWGCWTFEKICRLAIIWEWESPFLKHRSDLWNFEQECSDLRIHRQAESYLSLLQKWDSLKGPTSKFTLKLLSSELSLSLKLLAKLNPSFSKDSSYAMSQRTAILGESHVELLEEAYLHRRDNFLSPSGLSGLTQHFIQAPLVAGSNALRSVF